MTVVLIADKEASPHSSPVDRALVARSVAVRQIVHRRGSHASASLVTANDPTFAVRLRRVLDDLSQAMTSAYAITPAFGRLQTRGSWSDREHCDYAIAQD
jgi:hypothetical protein